MNGTVIGVVVIKYTFDFLGGRNHYRNIISQTSMLTWSSVKELGIVPEQPALL